MNPKNIFTNKYGRYYISESFQKRNAIVPRTVIAGKVFEPDTIQCMIDNCGDGDIIHAGAFFGDFVPALSKNISEDALVWTFEPNPESFDCCVKTIELNEIKNVRLSPYGLGEVEKEAYITTHKKNGKPFGGRAFINNKKEGGNDIQVISLDSFIPPDRNISVLQLDVEGYEKYALSGALELIKRELPVLILEFGDVQKGFYTSDWFTNTILSLGYKKKFDVHKNHVFITEGE